MNRVPHFLDAVLGADGAKALIGLASRQPELSALITPRAILGWVGVALNYGYNGAIPGCPGTQLTLAKGETGSGSLRLTDGGELYALQNAPLSLVAAGVAVALGMQPQAVGGEPARLGSAIDLLIKAQLVKGGAEPAGPHAAPLAPVPQGPPTSTQTVKGPTTPKAKGPGKSPVLGKTPKVPTATAAPSAAPAAPGVPKPPTTKCELPGIHVKKDMMDSTCPKCGKKRFEKSEFRGCDCWSGEGVESRIDGSGVMLAFTSKWKRGTILALADIISKGL